MKITLVRHTEVQEKYHKRYNGHIDIGLSSLGVTQAKNLASYFKEREFDLVYCSDLKRARDTLSPFVQADQAIYTPKLREKSWGKHEGLSFDEIIAEGEIEYVDFVSWINALGGEDYELYVQRVREFFFRVSYHARSREDFSCNSRGSNKSFNGHSSKNFTRKSL